MAKYKQGLAAIFLTEEQILEATRKTRERGFTKFEAISPYPIHGMEEAAGIKRSWIPYVTFV
ncbi:MAG: quinol:electron acceptor oxidoreductase subunit ActD, partial [Pseudobdellovibrionaceae bacterium]